MNFNEFLNISKRESTFGLESIVQFRQSSIP